MSRGSHDGSKNRTTLSQQSKKELLEVVRERYVTAKRKEKQRILDELVAATGYHRKYAIRVLRHVQGKRLIRKRGRKKIYQGEVVIALEQIWEVCGRICSKRLQPFLPEMLKVLERVGAISLSADTKKLLLSMSRASIDRCLTPARKTKGRGLSTTKPGSLLKKAIPVHTCPLSSFNSSTQIQVSTFQL